MDSLLLLLLIIVLVILVHLKNNITSKLAEMQYQMNLLANELKKHVQPEVKPKSQEPILTHKPLAPIPEIKEVPPLPVTPPIPQEKGPLPEIKEKEPELVKIGNLVHQGQKQPVPNVPGPHVTPPKPGFFERNPDLEKFIGENLANKIGIAILVIGIGFFVKYAIDKEWINEYGRTFIGLLCGGILLGLAHRMRQNFAAFSSVLVGGGIAILYLTITIAFQVYGIIGQVPAFMIMIGITAFTIFLSISYNRLELAILAILGGFGAPFMVTSGEGSYGILFTYIMILDVGMLILAYYRKWNSINIIAYAFTVILFGSWIARDFDGESPGMTAGGMIFATLFYLVFFGMNLVNNLKAKRKFQALEISLLLSNTFLYYAAGMVMLRNPYTEDFQGLFTACVGIFNFAFAYTLYKRSNVDRNLVFLLIGLVLTFISLAAPVQLKGNYITLFWAAEAVLLLWLSQQSGIKLMKLSSVIVMTLMVISLLMDWEILYFTGSAGTTLNIIFNKAYITSVFALGSIAFTIRLLRNEFNEYLHEIKVYKWILMITAVVVLYFSQLFELRYHVIRLVDLEATQNIILGIYNLTFLIGLSFASYRFTMPKDLKTAFAGWGILGMFLYLFFYHGQVIIARNQFLMGNGSLGFLLHYVLIVVLIGLAITSLQQFRRLNEFNERTSNAYSWFFVFFFVFVASAELDHSVLLTVGATAENISSVLRQNHKIGFPILWGLSSFLLIFIGLRTKRKNLRIISLSLMLITLLKLFLLDIRGISEGGKIAAFISLGILLLIVSFMYQRLKKILLADEGESAEQNKPTL